AKRFKQAKPQSGCSQNLAGRGQILLVLQVNSCSIDQESGEVGQAGKPHSGGSQICAVQANLQ
ncbi:MAG: hypothetical protein COZ77_02150, partial [Gallionellales bacterium CG_4_8_14_3_um_filter_54_18]